MVLELLEQKYKINCGRGIDRLKDPGILGKLQDTLVLGNDLDHRPTLQPGDVFMINKNIIAVNSPDELILVHFSSGINFFKRFKRELDEEYDFIKRKNLPSTEKLEFVVQDNQDWKKTYEGVYYPMTGYALFNKYFVKHSSYLGNLSSDQGVLVTVPGIIPVSFVVTGTDGVHFDKTRFDIEEDEDILEEYSVSIISELLKRQK